MSGRLALAAMELLLVRHGLPLRVDNSASGLEADPALSVLGERQAEALADWLVGGPAATPIAAVYASPKLRAQGTVAPLAQRLGLEVIIEPRVIEYDVGENEYIPIEELKGTPAWAEMLAAGIPDPEVFQAQVVAGMEAIIAAHPGGRVVVGCHGGVVAAYLAHLLGISEPMFFEAHYTSVNRVMAASSGERSVVSMNELAHLQVAKVPLSDYQK
ncbi:MAG: histidine phosphatase family protein [Actinobacteria bacterium]|nr:histidine phosphatase family protein [Actinomycetota bacterium]